MAKPVLGLANYCLDKHFKERGRGVNYLEEYIPKLPLRIDFIARIGSNNRFIIAQDKGGCYWIVDKEKNEPSLKQDEFWVGPLSSEEFETKKCKLGIMGISLREI